MVLHLTLLILITHPFPFFFFFEIPGLLYTFLPFWLDCECKPINFAYACVVCFLCHIQDSLLLPRPPLTLSHALLL